ncbi:MAG: hypothetical protein AAF700_12680 [Pseudomonadota bacterium]
MEVAEFRTNQYPQTGNPLRCRETTTARANECCVSEGPKPKVGIVRVKVVGAWRSEWLGSEKQFERDLNVSFYRFVFSPSHL